MLNIHQINLLSDELRIKSSILDLIEYANSNHYDFDYDDVLIKCHTVWIPTYKLEFTNEDLVDENCIKFCSFRFNDKSDATDIEWINYSVYVNQITSELMLSKIYIHNGKAVNRIESETTLDNIKSILSDIF